MTMTTPTVAVKAALRFYPARYRRERGDELAAVFSDTTAEAGAPAVVREALDLAAYGLRVRTRLTAFSAGGRLLALAAPVIAGAIAGAGLYPWVSDTDLLAWRLGHTSSVITLVAAFAQPVASLLLALAAFLGRWTEARVIAVAVMAAGLLGMKDAFAVDRVDAWWILAVGSSAMPFVLAGLLVIAAPRELLAEPTWRTRAVVPASMVGGWSFFALQGGFDSHYMLNGPRSVALVVPPLFLVLTALRGRLVPAAIGLAVLPLTVTFSMFTLWQTTGGLWYLLPISAVAVVLMAAPLMIGSRGGAGGARGLA
ncbi:hypothetical protein [Kitasatospora sp. NPDC056181]|uniref:hypothetical protein n=1 Tax=Kitasatospora sp. NPDC056181 TaxID=3345737 RepID=UPI0035D87259